MKRFALLAVVVPLVAVSVLPAAPKDVDHPFILWTEDEAAAIRKKIESDPQAKAQYARMKSTGIGKGNRTLLDLFEYMVMGDKAAGERQKKALLGFIGRVPDARIPLEKDLVWHEGSPSSGDRHMRDEQTLNTLRYDVLYHELTPPQRKGVEDSLRAYIEFHLSGHKPWHPHFRYDRMSWLPNMHWPRAIGTHLMAVALKDEKLIKDMFHSAGGVKWWFDHYVGDGRFYMEEFGKYYSNIGTLLMYAEALEQLGLGQYGYGYVAKDNDNASIRTYLEMRPWTSYPRIDRPEGGTAQYPCIVMGDAGGTHLVEGYDAKGRWRDRIWSDAHMNGPLPKMHHPLWWEICHNRWPDDGFDYFLAQMRAPGEQVYLPSLYFGCGPVDARKVTPPPAESWVSRERGLAMLRAEEGPDYWESPAPAVAQQFAMYYVHYVHDCFSILGFSGYNRLLYHRMGKGTKKGYAGGDAWRDHVRGHCGVVVDGLKAQPADRGNVGARNHRLRYLLEGAAKFSTAQADGVYAGVELERSLVLTRQYLFDVYWLRSDRARTYDWQVLAYGDLQRDEWPDADVKADRPLDRPQVHSTKVLPAEGQWKATIIQKAENGEQPVGVRVSMLPEKGTYVLGSLPPGMKSGGTSLIVTRKKPETAFAALHQPFQGDAPARAFEQIDRKGHALAVRVAGDGVDDRILLAWGDASGARQTLSGAGERFAFREFGFVRVSKDAVTVTGDVTELAVKVAGSPKLLVNGQETPATVERGMLKATIKVEPVVTVLQKDPLPPVRPQSVDDYAKLLRHPVCARREQAAMTLARMGEKAAPAAPALVEALVQKDLYGNKYIPEALAGIGGKSLDAIHKLMGHEDDYVRHEAITALRLMESDAAPAVEALIAAVDDENRFVARNAVMALGTTGPKAAPAIDRLRKALTDSFLKQDAAIALASIGSKSLGALTEALGDDAAFGAAAAAIQALGPKASEAVGPLTAALKDPKKFSAAAGALQGLGPAAAPAVEALSGGLKSDATRTSAARALGAIGPKAASAVPVLREYVQAEVKDRKGNTRREWQTAVIVALGQIGPKAESALPAILPAVAEEKYRKRAAALRAATQIAPGDADVRKAILAAMGSTSRRSRGLHVVAAEALTAGEATEAFVGQLEKLLAHKEPEVRINAAYALIRLGKPEEKAFATLSKALKSEDRRAAETAADRIRRLGARAARLREAVTKAIGAQKNRHVRRALQAALQALGES